MGAGVVVSCWVVAALDVTAEIGEITLRVVVLQTVSERFCMDPTSWGFFCICPAVACFFSEFEVMVETVTSRVGILKFCILCLYFWL